MRANDWPKWECFKHIHSNEISEIRSRWQTCLRFWIIITQSLKLRLLIRKQWNCCDLLQQNWNKNQNSLRLWQITDDKINLKYFNFKHCEDKFTALERAGLKLKFKIGLGSNMTLTRNVILKFSITIPASKLISGENHTSKRN